jgi:hypothetical protein
LNNNNRNNNNNRRRGRSNNNRPQGGGSGQQLNRIDSRARGNAPQLLEKYRKLAHDAHLNGDRVQAEYYLQFADHYFRVLADQRVRQDEQRGKPDRWQEGGEGYRENTDDSGEFSAESDFPSFDSVPNYSRPVRPAQDERPREGRLERAERPDRNSERPRRDDSPDRTERPERAERMVQSEAEGPAARDEAQGGSGGDDGSNFEAADNPFVRHNPAPRGLRPRRDDRRPAREPADRATADRAEPVGLDPALLPPAISVARDEGLADDDAPAPKRPRGRPRKVRPEDGGTDETLESVG